MGRFYIASIVLLLNLLFLWHSIPLSLLLFCATFRVELGLSICPLSPSLLSSILIFLPFVPLQPLLYNFADLLSIPPALYAFSLRPLLKSFLLIYQTLPSHSFPKLMPLSIQKFGFLISPIKTKLPFYFISVLELFFFILLLLNPSHHHHHHHHHYHRHR